MTMKTVQVVVPQDMVPFLDPEGNGLTFEQRALLLYPFVRCGKISHGRAAELLGVRKLDLIDTYCALGLPYLDQSVEELEAELKDIRDFEGRAI